MEIPCLKGTWMRSCSSASDSRNRPSLSLFSWCVEQHHDWKREVVFRSKKFWFRLNSQTDDTQTNQLTWLMAFWTFLPGFWFKHSMACDSTYSESRSVCRLKVSIFETLFCKTRFGWAILVRAKNVLRTIFRVGERDFFDLANQSKWRMDNMRFPGRLSVTAKSPIIDPFDIPPGQRAWLLTVCHW